MPTVKSYLGNALHLLVHLAEESTSTFILRRLRASIAFLPQFEALQKKYIKLVLGFFGTSLSRRVRIQALLWLRDLAIAAGQKGLDDVLKGAYRTFAAHAAFVTKASIPDIAFMGTGIVELYSLQPSSSYEHIFGFVAQLVCWPLSSVLMRDDCVTMNTVRDAVLAQYVCAREHAITMLPLSSRAPCEAFEVPA
jgi:nucleolar complex protein 2